MKGGFIPAPDGRGGFMPTDIEGSFQVRDAIIGNQAPGAIPTGRTVRKINSEPEDRTPEGHTGIILGSFGHGKPVVIGDKVATYGYLIMWEGDDTPVFTTDGKVEEVE
jgi:hypothetical protein